MEQQTTANQASQAPESAAESTDFIFPYEPQSDHWDVNFGNSNEVYEGSDLPIWILAGWAIFIIWAVIYLIAGTRTAF